MGDPGQPGVTRSGESMGISLSTAPHRRVTHFSCGYHSGTLSPIGGEGRVRGRLSPILTRVLQMVQDRLHDRLTSLEDIMIPEADHEVALAREVRRAFLVATRLLRFGVATAVELDHEKSSSAAEVGDILPDPVLTSKFPAEEATVA